jgi:hypothetical protein
LCQKKQNPRETHSRGFEPKTSKTIYKACLAGEELKSFHERKHKDEKSDPEDDDANGCDGARLCDVNRGREAAKRGRD